MPEPVERNFSMWTYHERLLAELPRRERPEETIVDAASLEAWQVRFRSRLTEVLGVVDRPDDLLPELSPPLDGDRQGGFTRHRLVYRAEPHLDVPAWLLIPTGRHEPGPAVVAVHGHGPDRWTFDLGRDAVCGPPPADPDMAAASIAQCAPFGAALAQAGFVVLAPDLRGFGERWDRWPEGHRMCDIELTQHLARGDLPLVGNLRDLAAGLDLLAAHPLVDADRLGVVGFSYGGTLALFLAAVDERVRATVVSGAFSDPREAARIPTNLCGAQVVPGLLVDLDHVHLGAAIAPRPLFLENGDADFLWPADAARTAAERLARIYDVVGAPASLEHHTFDGEHRWHGDGVESFLAHHLPPSTDSTYPTAGRRGDSNRRR